MVVQVEGYVMVHRVTLVIGWALMVTVVSIKTSSNLLIPLVGWSLHMQGELLNFVQADRTLF